MSHTDDDAQRETLEEWIADLRDALRLSGLEVPFAVDVAGLLALAGEAAHAVLRPAAPLTTFAVGYAAGRAAGSGSDPAAAVADAVAATRALLAERAAAERAAAERAAAERAAAEDGSGEDAAGEDAATGSAEEGAPTPAGSGQ